MALADLSVNSTPLLRRGRGKGHRGKVVASPEVGHTSPRAASSRSPTRLSRSTSTNSHLRPRVLQAYNYEDNAGKKQCALVPENYSELCFISNGTFGSVVGAVRPDPATGKSEQVVVKAIRLSTNVTAESALRELHNLIFFTKKAPHPAIVRLLDCWIADNTLFAVLPRYEHVLHSLLGETVEDLRRNKPCIPAKERRLMTVMLLQAVNHLHSYGLVHRDLKPGNVVVSGDRRSAAIIDLGSLRKPEDANTWGPPLTPARQCMTDGYHPPETLKDGGRLYSREADVFAIGLILIELVTGQEVFEDNQGLKKHLDNLSMEGKRKKYVEKLIASYAGVTSAEIDLITSLLAAHPAARLSCEQALRSLKVPVFAPIQGVKYREPTYNPDHTEEIKKLLEEYVAEFRKEAHEDDDEEEDVVPLPPTKRRRRK
eukprot:Sspe_Gene.36871::Locus_17813_Transcript_1_1_Confidence_1.000_Length_1593::g.36871::m.36871/K04441/P38; p38 MAP kinase